MARAQKINAIVAFLEGRKSHFHFGALSAHGNRIYTYGVLLAHVDRTEAESGHVEEIEVELNDKNYSQTSTAHKNLVVLATGCVDPACCVTYHLDGIPDSFS